MNKNKKTNKEIREQAKKFGYVEERSNLPHGQLTFRHEKRKLYISYDIDGHNGGYWKMATSIRGLDKKNKIRNI